MPENFPRNFSVCTQCGGDATLCYLPGYGPVVAGERLCGWCVADRGGEDVRWQYMAKREQV